MVIDDTGSVEDIHAFIHFKKWRSGQVLLMPDSQRKDRATQLLIKYKSGALVTQLFVGVKVALCVLFLPPLPQNRSNTSRILLSIGFIVLACLPYK